MSSFNVYRQKKSTMKKNTTLILILIATILVILFLGSTLLTTLSSLNGQNAGASDCLVSFGRYNGHTYKSEDTVGEGKCLVQSKWMQVMQHKVRLNDKTLIDDWLFIDYHDRINVLVEDPENNNTNEGPTQFLIFRQTKYALEGRQSLAIVGGIIEPQEEAQHAAAREVKEELGLNCQMQLLGRFRTDVNRGMGWVNSFIAHDCEKESLQDESKIDPNEEVGAADSEKQKVISMTLQEVVQRVRNGEFVEVQWSNTVALAMMNKRYN